MFWRYCESQGLHFTPVTEIHNISDEGISSNQNSQGHEIDKQYYDLTKEDHLLAGYDKIKKPWTEEEDKLVKELRDKKSLEWDEISSFLPGRNAKMCYSRYKRLEYKPREHWKPSEDELLKKLVEQNGQNWTQIFPFFPNRTLKQIKDHYLNYLKQEVNREHWTIDEDVRLVDLLNKHGKNWKQIESQMPDRTQNQIKNRFFGRIKKLQDKKNKTDTSSEIPEL